MKTTCSVSFRTTLTLIGLDYAQWLVLSQCRRRRRTALRPRWMRQYVRKVQRVHTGTGGLWRDGQYIIKKLAP